MLARASRARMDSVNYLVRWFCTCTLPYLLRPATVAFCGNSWILDRVCGLICGAWDTFCEVYADLGIRTSHAGRDSVGPERNINSSARNVDTSSHHFRTAST